jgi:hypothetical protein
MALVGDAKRYSGSSDSVSARAMAEITFTMTTEQPGRYVVDVSVGDVATTHQVRVPAGLAEKIGGPGTSDEELVEGSFRYLLEREPNTSILRSFSLDQIGGYFPGWSEEMAHRLGT